MPEAGQVLINVKAAGLCHTDVGTITGELTPPVLPVTMGHEIFGTVAALGEADQRPWLLRPRFTLAVLFASSAEKGAQPIGHAATLCDHDVGASRT